MLEIHNIVILINKYHSTSQFLVNLSGCLVLSLDHLSSPSIHHDLLDVFLVQFVIFLSIITLYCYIFLICICCKFDFILLFSVIRGVIVLSSFAVSESY